MYSLNGISLEGLGFIGGKQSGSNIALSGFLDFPSRLGKTFHDWAGEDGIEPYVSADEIFFGGRDVKLTGFIKGTDRADCEYKRLQLSAIFDNATGLMPLVSKWGTQNILVNGKITSEFMSSRYLKINIPMREPVVDLTGVIPDDSSAEFGIDGISFKSLGGYYLELSGDRRNRPEPKASAITVYGAEAYSITKTKAPELELKLYIKQPTYADFKAKITGLYALLSAPGMRNLTAKNDKIRSFFVTDGFTVDKMYSIKSASVGVVTCKLTESGIGGTFGSLADNFDVEITDNNNNVIQVRL